MSEYSINDWTPFRVGKRSTKKNWTEPSCQLLTVVSHVTHIRPAITVLRDGQVSPQLIYDKSRLNTERILVVWLSPNDWDGAGGFRYGNIAFELNWADLIAGKRYYWVGAMKYNPTACRILITDQDRDGQLKPYEPETGDGPWWYDAADDEHYWNGNYCLEFMLEGPVSLDCVRALDFVKHHSQRCSISPSSCPDRGHDSLRGGARFLAGSCAARVLRPLLWLKDDDTPSRALTSAWGELRQFIIRKVTKWRGPVSDGSSAALPLARSVLATISEWRIDDRSELVALFRSEQDAIEASAQLIENCLNLADGTLSRSDDDDY